MSNFENIEEIYDFISTKLDLSENYRIETKPIFEKTWTPLKVDLVIKDNIKLFLVEIKSKPRVETISKLVTIKEIFIKQKRDIKNYYFVIVGKVFPPHIIEMAKLLNIKLIEIPKKMKINIPKYDIFKHRIKVSSEKSWKIITRLLKEKSASIRQLSIKEDISYGWAYDTIQNLIQQGIVEKKDTYVKIVDIDKLLNGIAWERPFETLKKEEINLEYNKTHKAAKDISKMLNQKNIKFAFTSFTAGGLYTGYAIRMDSIYIYLNRDERDFFKKIFKTPKKDGIKAQIYLPDRDVFSETKKIEQIVVVSPSQALLDLAGLGYGGRDLAIAMVDKYANL